MGLSISTTQMSNRQLEFVSATQRVTIPSSENLVFIYIAIVRSKLGNTEIFYEQTIEDETNGNFEIELPRPSNSIGSWTVMVHGYRHDGSKVFNFEKNAALIF